MKTALLILGWIILAPVFGGILAGIDRIITARMQSRVGPPVLQPFYDVFKLLSKQNIVVNAFQNFYMVCFLVFVIITGVLFFSGGDLLLTIFALTVAGVFFVLGAYSPNSPYSNIGAERELIQMMSYEPALIISAIGMYLVTNSWNVNEIIASSKPVIKYLPGVFFAFVFVLTIKLRKSPFDLSTSHHGHQELVKGVTTEFAGPALAIIEIAHWYENILLLGFIFLFFSFNWIAAIIAIIATYFLEILIDNTYARLTWHFTVRASWLVAALFGVSNIILLLLLNGK
jgi:formate hydrogenlyase subunit 4